MWQRKCVDLAVINSFLCISLHLVFCLGKRSKWHLRNCHTFVKLRIWCTEIQIILINSQIHLILIHRKVE
jgi:hypothetical protein